MKCSFILRGQREHRPTASYFLRPHFLQGLQYAPKAATLDGQKVVPADCVSVLLMALGSTTITKAQYEMMSALDGTRTASSFEHQFRTITAKAKELKARAEKGETFQAVTPVNKRGEY